MTTPAAHTPQTHAPKPIGRAEIDHALNRLRHGRADYRNLPSAYPILARWGEIEATPNGWVMIDPETALRRIDRLIAKLSAL